MICPNCGTSLHENSTICMYCKTPIERKAPSGAVPLFNSEYSSPMNTVPENPQTKEQNKNMVVILSVFAAVTILIILCIFLVVSKLKDNSNFASGEKFRENPDVAMDFDEPYEEPEADDTDDDDTNIVVEDFDEPVEE